MTDELISRQAAIDALWEIRKEEIADGRRFKNYCSLSTAVDVIRDLPSAQPEIIMCKDCKWYNDKERICNDLMSFGRYWKPDDFCSYGKRRTDG